MIILSVQSDQGQFEMLLLAELMFVFSFGISFCITIFCIFGYFRFLIFKSVLMMTNSEKVELR